MQQASERQMPEDPFYYLANFRQLVDWFQQRYVDLLSTEEAGHAALACHQYPSTFHHSEPITAKISSSTTHMMKPTRHQLPIVTKPLPKMIGEVPVA